MEDDKIEELADVMEVLFGFDNRMGFSEEDLINARNKKREERSGFESRIVLKKVIKNK